MTGRVKLDIASAPRDGTFIKLFFRTGFNRETWEQVGAWRNDPNMKAGGAWFDREGKYITPGPLFWLPEIGSVQ